LETRINMRKNTFYKIIILFSLIFALFGNVMSAEEEIPVGISPEGVTIEDINQTPITINIHLKISSFYDQDITVNPCDSDNNPSTLDTVTAYCAVLQTGLPSTWDWSWAPGAFVTSINNINGYTTKDKDNNDVYHYWSWSLKNGMEGMTGLNQYVLQTNDSILLDFIDPVVEEATPIVKEIASTHHHHSSGGIIQKTFSISKALSYLEQNQKDDGSFGDFLYTDWVAIGIGGMGDEVESLKNKISDYLKSENFQSSVVTDNERHAMALMSLGINPYDATETNYINKIISSYDGSQIGDLALINDDIFGLIVLSHAGYGKDDEMIKNVVSNLISEQFTDGSWGSVDMTAATIEALDNFPELKGVTDSISKAKSYLRGEQKDDGSFADNPYSTSWVVQALSTNDSSYGEVNRAIQYLADRQQDDGGLSDGEADNRIWDTAYAIPAVMKLSWNDILKSFPKKEEIIDLPIIQNIQEPTTIKEIKKVASSATRQEGGKKPIENKQVVQENSNNNLLTASTIGANQNQTSIFSSITSKVLRIIASPFISLWIRLGF
jgi:hypothetical protein